ncbi:hypothetical protein WN48_04570 [Eufriesea mexicana]|nr:hypothetical protein WN48_04570 [Eufriesea mexicana]
MRESLENEIGGILKFTKSIGDEGFVNMAIEDVQDLLVEEVDEMASEAVNRNDSEDTSTDENFDIRNIIRLIYRGIVGLSEQVMRPGFGITSPPAEGTLSKQQRL